MIDKIKNSSDFVELVKAQNEGANITELLTGWRGLNYTFDGQYIAFVSGEVINYFANDMSHAIFKIGDRFLFIEFYMGEGHTAHVTTMCECYEVTQTVQTNFVYQRK